MSFSPEQTDYDVMDFIMGMMKKTAPRFRTDSVKGSVLSAAGGVEMWTVLNKDLTWREQLKQIH